MDFSGTYTALVTPFHADGSVDYTALEALSERQIKAGVDGLVPAGTTGESPTLRTDEHLKVIKTVVRTAAGRCKIIAGTGSNSTAEAVELTMAAQALGVDATLQVTPYYNKPNNAGLVKHFSAVADLGLPVLLYNVPGRTSREIPLDVVAELAEHPNIVSVKEAAGSVERVTAIKARCDIEVLSGDDALALSMTREGACGVISVASNVIPAEMETMIRAAMNRNFETANALHDQYKRFFDRLLVDTNPIPVKAALAMQGLVEETYRLPLCPMDNEKKRMLRAALRQAGVLA